MEHNSGEVYSPTILQSPITEQQYPVGFVNVPGHENGNQGSLGHKMMQIETTEHNTEQGSGSGSGLPRGNEAMVGDIRIGEQGSGSVLCQANMQTDVTPDVPESKAAVYSRRSREKKQKQNNDMEVKVNRLEEENKRLRKDNKKLTMNQKKSKRKLDVQSRKICKANGRLAKSQKAYNELKIQTNSLSKSLENISHLQQENKRLKADNDLLMQQVNAGTKGKKKKLAKVWVKIPLEDRIIKIKGNYMFINMA